MATKPCAQRPRTVAKQLKPFDAAGNFCSITTGSGLRRAAVRGAGATILASGTSLLVQIGATVILARLLTPADFGIVTMVTTFSLLFCSFGLNGFKEAILQREEVTSLLASNMFWANVGVSMFPAVGDGSGQTFLRLPFQQVNNGMSLGVAAHGLCCAIGAVVIHYQNFPDQRQW